MIGRSILLMMVALSAPSAASGAQPYRDHLVPEESVIGNSEAAPDYEIVLRDVFHEAYDRDIRLRYVEIPSFHTESVVALREDKGSFAILTLEPKIQLWSYESLAMMKRGQVLKVENNDFKHGVRPDKEIAELEATLPEDYHKVPVNRCEAPVDAALANRLLAAWKSMLLDTRYVQPGEGDVVVSDGTAGHFSMFSDFEFLAGWTNYAPDNGKLAALWALPSAMSDYCATPNAASLKKLDTRVGALEALLPKQPSTSQKSD